MTLNTDDLIRRLSRDLQAAPSLGHPFLRSIAWTTGAGIYVALVVMWMASPDAVMGRWSDPAFTIQQLAALATTFTAAAAALSMTVPGRGRIAVRVTIASASLWLGLVLSGCIQDWMAAGSAGLALRNDWTCVAGISMTAAFPGLALAVMLRRGAPLQPYPTAALGALGVASLASLGMCAAQPHERDVIVFVWHGATIAALSALAGLTGRLILKWKHLSHSAFVR
jgi:hypothetical protein